LHPWRHAAVNKAVQRSRGWRRDIVERVEREVHQAFEDSRLKVGISGREKTAYSIYRKMRQKHSSFAQVNDLFGFRVVVPDTVDCYTALGVLHQLYKPVPGRFKDYIAIPKANGYQSLHTTLVSPLGTAVEFQIRSQAMDAVAESGIAAHWMYKSKESAHDAQQLGAMWLKSLIDIQDETRDPAEFLEHVKIDLAPDSVYVFTPKSRILALPRGATPVDFAYAIHSDVGDHCVAAQVNGEAVALSTELRSGDVVEVTTSPSAKPNPAWLNFVSTGRARSKIRHFLKTLEQEESYLMGERMLTQALRAEGLVMPDTSGDDAPAEVTWAALVRWAGSRNRSELFTDIGTGRKIATIVAKRLARLLVEAGQRPDAITLSMGRFAASAEDAGHGLVLLDGSEGASVKYAPCCRPIPGDAVVGYLGRGEGLTVHTAECSVARKLGQRDSEHWMSVDWAEESVRPFETAISTVLRNGKGVLAQVAQAVALAEADITHLDMGDNRADDVTTLRLVLNLRDRQQLADVLRRLRRSPPVIRVSRVKS
ncbi:MAG: RelA/SpoT family protein, partial [Betaproteobacteria bacterium]